MGTRPKLKLKGGSFPTRRLSRQHAVSFTSPPATSRAVSKLEAARAVRDMSQLPRSYAEVTRAEEDMPVDLDLSYTASLSSESLDAEEMNVMDMAAESCEGDANFLEEKYLSLLKHVSNVHRWEDGYEMTGCKHADLPQDDQTLWLVKDSNEYNVLEKNHDGQA